MVKQKKMRTRRWWQRRWRRRRRRRRWLPRQVVIYEYIVNKSNTPHLLQLLAIATFIII
jgi:hypothetical protein